MKRYASVLGAAVLVAAFSLSGGACSSTETQLPPPATEPGAKAEDYSVQTNMQETWGSESALTRAYLIETLAGLPDASFARDRLLAAQTQVGDLMASFYEPRTTNYIQNLLRDRTQILVDYADAIRTSDNAGSAAAAARLDGNGKTLAMMLANGILSPVNLEKVLGGLLQAQGVLLRQEIAARIAGDFRAATTAHDGYQAHVSLLAETLFDVVANTRPDLIASTNLLPKERAVYTTMHDLWLAHESLTREWLVSAIAGLPGTSEALNELLHNQRAMGTALTTYYGGEVGNTATTLLGTHVILADGYVGAAKAHDTEKMAMITTQLYGNADAIAALLEGANPSWKGTMASAWRDDVNHTLGQITARVAQDWKLDLVYFDLNAHDGSKMADVMAAGIVKQGGF